MKRTIKSLLVASVIAGFATAANADLVGYWNFNGLSIATASAPGAGGVPTSISADSGAGTVSLTGWTGLVDDFSGSTGNALNSDPSGASLSLVSSAGNGSYIQIAFSMSGYENVQISFDTRGTSTGFDSGVWSYSTDGSNFTGFGANTATRSTSYSTVAAFGTTGLDNAATAYLRYTLNNATSAAGNNRIDNLQLNATALPEPATLGLLAVGGLVMISRRRRA